MKKMLLFSTIVAILLSACFSPWKEDDAVITLSLGGANNRAVYGMETVNGNENGDENEGENAGKKAGGNDLNPKDVIKFLEHKVLLSGSGGNQTYIFAKGEGTVQITVAPGRYSITVEAILEITDLLKIEGYEESDLIDIFGATTGKFPIARGGPKSVNVIAGKSNSVDIQMELISQRETSKGDGDDTIETTFEIEIWEDEDILVSSETSVTISKNAAENFMASIKGAERYESFEWYISSGEEFTGVTSITIEAAEYLTGTYQLLVVVYKVTSNGTVPYSAVIDFTVEE